MGNLVLNTLVNESNYQAIAAYLQNKNLKTMPEADIREAINIIDNETHDFQIKELLYQFLLKNDVKIIIKGKLDKEDLQMFKNLFRFALHNNKFDIARQLLENIDYGVELLNQTNNNKTLVEEAITSNNNAVFEFLLGNRAYVNSAIDRDNFLNHPEKIERIAECSGDFSKVMNENPELVFIAAEQAEQYPNRFQQALNASSNLLSKCEFTQPGNNRDTHVYHNIFEQIISMQNWPLLTTCLQHVKNVVIKQQKALRCLDVEKPVAHEQMINCALLLDYCITLSKSTDENIQKAFLDAKLTFEYNPNITETESDAFFFNQGLLRFLKLYHLEQDLPDLAPFLYPEDKQRIISADKLLCQTAAEIIELADDEYYRFLPIFISIHLMHLINAADDSYKTSVREPYVREQQREAIEREQRLRPEREEQLRIATQMAEQIGTDLRLNLPALYTELLNIINEISKVTNDRDNKKIKFEKYSNATYVVTFATAYVFACLMIRDNYTDKKQASINNFLICFGIYSFEFIMKGFLDGLFAHNENDVNDRMLEFGQLPQVLQNKITDLMQRLDPLHLKVDIQPECKIKQLINLLLNSARKANQRLLTASQNPENINPTELIDYDWNAPSLSKKDFESLLLCWVVALLVQGMISYIIGVRNQPYKDSYDPNMEDKLWSAAGLTFLAPTILALLTLFEHVTRRQIASTQIGPKLTAAYDCLTSSCTRTQVPSRDIEMALLSQGNSGFTNS